MYLSLLRQKQHGSSNACKNSNACGYGETCYLCRNTKGYCCKKIVTGLLVCCALYLMHHFLHHNAEYYLPRLTCFPPTSGPYREAKWRTH